MGIEQWIQSKQESNSSSSLQTRMVKGQPLPHESAVGVKSHEFKSDQIK